MNKCIQFLLFATFDQVLAQSYEVCDTSQIIPSNYYDEACTQHDYPMDEEYLKTMHDQSFLYDGRCHTVDYEEHTISMTIQCNSTYFHEVIYDGPGCQENKVSDVYDVEWGSCWYNEYTGEYFSIDTTQEFGDSQPNIYSLD